MDTEERIPLANDTERGSRITPAWADKQRKESKKMEKFFLAGINSGMAIILIAWPNIVLCRIMLGFGLFVLFMAFMLDQD